MPLSLSSSPNRGYPGGRGREEQLRGARSRENAVFRCVTGGYAARKPREGGGSNARAAANNQCRPIVSLGGALPYRYKSGSQGEELEEERESVLHAYRNSISIFAARNYLARLFIRRADVGCLCGRTMRGSACFQRGVAAGLPLVDGMACWGSLTWRDARCVCLVGSGRCLIISDY